MTRAEVIEAFCALSEQVMSKKFNCSRAADCFCSDDPKFYGNFQFEPEIIEFINSAVQDALRKEKSESLWD
jgi:hypothetical protein